jgi:hypothetical protein
MQKEQNPLPIDQLIEKELRESIQEANKDNYKTNAVKKQFIQEIKNGLGDKIKLEPNKVKIIKKPWYIKLKQSIKNIFTKF